MCVLVRMACLSDIGSVRKKNEDNFCFQKRTMDRNHRVSDNMAVRSGAAIYRTVVCVFDGMGGEACGEVASSVAAQYAQKAVNKIPARSKKITWYLAKLCHDMNFAVFNRAQELQVSRMGSTAAILYLKGRRGYICNLGDSKVFRLRKGVFEQLSVDHTDQQELIKRGIKRKPRLTQHLGVDPNEMLIEPYVASFPIKRKDYYLLCSDGLTDMLCNEEIQSTIEASKNVATCAEQLVRRAINNGGKDNITVIICKIQ